MLALVTYAKVRYRSQVKVTNRDIHMIKRYCCRWFDTIDGSSLAMFRVMFGALLLFESVNYGLFLCLDCMYRSSSLLFKYHRFEWVTLWPSVGLELHFLVMALSALCIILGLFYRAAMVIYTLCFVYVFLLAQALYLNHFYLTILFCCIMVFVPAHHQWSLDARRKPEIASKTVPAWSRLWLVVQLEIVLIYAGLVKLNFDWLNLEPMRLWMNAQSSGSHVFFQWLTQDLGIALASYGVILLHLVGAPLLLWRKTRLPVFIIYCVFHTVNAFVFNIGIFPWMTLAATLMLFDPDWPKQFRQWLRVRRAQHLPPISENTNIVSNATITSAYNFRNIAIGLVIFFWLLMQAVVPLRHWFIPGNVAWNEAGHRFSWRMKLRDKRGTAKFYLVVNDNAPIVVDPNEHLSRKQIRKMSCIPDLIWQYAQFLENEYGQQADDNVKVYVEAMCSLNTREPASMINRLIDLTDIERTEPVENWVLPMTKELPRKYL